MCWPVHAFPGKVMSRLRLPHGKLHKARSVLLAPYWFSVEHCVLDPTLTAFLQSRNCRQGAPDAIGTCRVCQRFLSNCSVPCSRVHQSLHQTHAQGLCRCAPSLTSAPPPLRRPAHPFALSPSQPSCRCRHRECAASRQRQMAAHAGAQTLLGRRSQLAHAVKPPRCCAP